jgi:hypothetical protein
LPAACKAKHGAKRSERSLTEGHGSEEA